MSLLMNVEKPLAFLLILFFGRMLRMKRQTLMHVMGVQQVILNCLLPALLYKGLANMPAGELSVAWQYALISFAFCFYLALGFILLNRFLCFATERAQVNTLMLMFTSLSPGLSALPYVEAVVASTPPGDFDAGKVGLADLGIKPYVLFVLYMVASAISASTSKLHGSSSAKGATSTTPSTVNLRAVKNLVISYFTEPVTAASILALALLISGPFPLSDQWIWGQAISRLAASCSPTIFLLIGIKLQRPERQHAGLLALMIYRSGLAFIFIALLSAVRSMRANEVMFWIFICNSAASFLGNMHIVRVSSQEDQAAHLRFHKLLEDNREGPQSQAIDDLLHQLDAAAMDLGEAIEQASMILGQDTLRLNGMGKGAECAAENQTALQELERLRSAARSFAPTLSLALITVSFAWTIALSAAISLVPVEVWEIRPVLPGVGIGMVLMGAACLKVSSEQQAKKPVSDGSAEGESARRGSIFDEANPDELTVLEAVEVIQQRGSFLPASEQREIEKTADWTMRQSITHFHQRGSLRSSSSLTASMMMRGCRETGELTEVSLNHNRGSIASSQPPTSKRDSIDSSSAVGVEVDRQMHMQMHTVSPVSHCSLDANGHLLSNFNTRDVQKLQDMPEHPSRRPGLDIPDCPTLLTQPAPSMKSSFLTGDEGTHNHRDCPSPVISAPASPHQIKCTCSPFESCTNSREKSQCDLRRQVDGTSRESRHGAQH